MVKMPPPPAPAPRRPPGVRYWWYTGRTQPRRTWLGFVRLWVEEERRGLQPLWDPGKPSGNYVQATRWRRARWHDLEIMAVGRQLVPPA